MQSKERLQNLGLFDQEIDAMVESGVVTEPFLIQRHAKLVEGRDVHPVATDSFIGRSRETYNAPWLVRELVQNFVDHNPQEHGTLNGVKCREETSADDPSLKEGLSRFTITGEWVFQDPTGIIALHSDKPPGVETAGGNGIGLKQTALRFLRDFDVSKFAVAGEGWSVDYNFLKADKINGAMKESGASKDQTVRVQHDWLVADVRKTKTKGRVSYVVETDNQEIIEALRSFNEIGVQDDNSYLKDPDIRTEAGDIKWLAASEQGRLFINGQVFNYKENGPNARDYWRGPTGVTVRLNHLKYLMSIDRPPASEWQMEHYLSGLVWSMKPEECVDQIRQTEYLWSNDTGDAKASPDAEVVIKIMVARLRYAPENEAVIDLFRWLQEQKYLAVIDRISDREIEYLRKKGYKICPKFFAELGVPTTASVLTDTEHVARDKPTLTETDDQHRAQREGVRVAGEELDIESIEDFKRLLHDRLKEYDGNLAVNDLPFSLKASFKQPVEDRLAYHVLHGIDRHRPAQALVSFARGFGAHGLTKGYLKDVYFTHGDSIVTLAAQNDRETGTPALVVKVTEVNGIGGDQFVIHFTCADEESYAALKRAAEPRPSLPAIKNRAGASWFRHLAPVAGVLGFLGVGGAAMKNVDLQNVEDFGRGLTLSASDKEQEDTLRTLEALLQSLKKKPDNELSPDVEEYKRWLGSGDFYGEATNTFQYFGGTTHQNILSRYNTNDVSGNTENREDVEISKLRSLFEKINPNVDRIEDFKISRNPTEQQLAKLALLSAYFELVSGLKVPGQLFLYEGRGALGVTFGQKNIGIHEKMLDVSLDEAMQAFTHEMAHTYPGASGHDLGFVRMEEALFTATSDRLYATAKHANAGVELTEKEKLLLQIEDRWDAI